MGPYGVGAGGPGMADGDGTAGRPRGSNPGGLHGALQRPSVQGTQGVTVTAHRCRVSGRGGEGRGARAGLRGPEQEGCVAVPPVT